MAETMRAALEALAKLDEVWLAGVMPSEWADRYGRSARHERQLTGAAAVRQYVEQVGTDGIALLCPRSAPRYGSSPPARTALHVVLGAERSPESEVPPEARG
ncbi:hypothetical protein ABT297_25680 [Dactylosporangium sp. NPDC000555]|uniref:hypothetical protein n=1 Tax=Dactylosporangium sp. NPDC000555 TaxID=3154260 RepID=UPI00332B7445